MRKHHWQKGFFDLEVPELTEEAVEFVRQNITEENYPVPVAFSGGKDSVCLAKIMELSGIPHQLNYSFTGIDPPEVVRFIRKYYPDCVFWKPKKTFWQHLRRHIPPSIQRRWCCDLLKKAPAKRAEYGKTQKVLGIRAEESPKRRDRGRMNWFQKKQNVHPIFYWNEAQLWEFIEYYNLQVPILYDEGFSRLGCIICPFQNAKQHEIGKHKWPNFYVKWEEEVIALWHHRKAQGRDMYHSCPEAYLQDWYWTGNPLWYEGKSRKGRCRLFEDGINS